MRKRMIPMLLGLCIALSVTADQAPVFYFAGQRLFLGMSKTEAATALSECCRLSPPADSQDKQLATDSGRMVGHFILSKQSGEIIGSVFFVAGKVARLTRPLDMEFNTGNDDVVAFARALDRSLISLNSDAPNAVVMISTQHERASNAESETLSFRFLNGSRSVELQIVTLDTPDKETGKRDSISLDEVLEAPR
jgi:hypothetical protein